MFEVAWYGNGKKEYQRITRWRDIKIQLKLSDMKDFLKCAKHIKVLKIILEISQKEKKGMKISLHL